jgi:hypothetical protein
MINDRNNVMSFIKEEYLFDICFNLILNICCKTFKQNMIPTLKISFIPNN